VFLGRSGSADEPETRAFQKPVVGRAVLRNSLSIMIFRNNSLVQKILLYFYNSRSPREAAVDAHARRLSSPNDFRNRLPNPRAEAGACRYRRACVL
jgi:hypothetical protein